MPHGYALAILLTTPLPIEVESRAAAAAVACHASLDDPGRLILMIPFVVSKMVPQERLVQGGVRTAYVAVEETAYRKRTVSLQRVRAHDENGRPIEPNDLKHRLASPCEAIVSTNGEPIPREVLKVAGSGTIGLIVQGWEE